ncbi:glycosyltransferase family 4 protein [Patescibacteria group bacterium]|nr:glycosyltransferase family 4 protein [Patescibacteria group bacterium]MBU4015862.1 glycosyltransferase family 4 protein [Patescibacteria group bacterium]MBU4098657.1 glycosyltransferase family 4 protein [Patescibacteria group bacterium]
MKIAIIAPVEESIPPQKYGGTEWIVYHIAHGLGKRGHEVDLFASGDSKKEKYYNLIPITPACLRSIPEFIIDAKMRETAKLLSIAEALPLLKNKKYDIINNHASWRLLLFADLINPKPITVHHMPLSLQYQQIVFKKHKKLGHIALSNNQRKDLPELNYLATIYNGVDINYYARPEQPSQQNNLIFLGRISENKGGVDAAIVAHELKKQLTVAAKVDITDEIYFSKFKPLIDNQYVTFLGELPHDKAINLLSIAKALIMPISYEDPCPLVPLESMACGTPVIAYSQGALPEQIIDGKTGFLVNRSKNDIRGHWIIKKTGIEGLGEAVQKIYSMNESEYKQMKKNCREHFEKNFTTEKMVDNYERVFTEYIKHPIL